MPIAPTNTLKSRLKLFRFRLMKLGTNVSAHAYHDFTARSTRKFHYCIAE